MDSATWSGGVAIAAPNASSRSAEPVLTRGCPVAVFGDTYTRAGDNESGGRRDIEGAESISACAAGVDHRSIIRDELHTAEHGHASSARIRRLRRCLAFGAQGGQERRGLNLGDASSHDRMQAHPPLRSASTTARERAGSADRRDVDRCLFGHLNIQSALVLARATADSRDPRKLPSSCLPTGVRIDSGWNCTPSTGNSRWRKPMIDAVSGLGSDFQRRRQSSLARRSANGSGSP